MYMKRGFVIGFSLGSWAMSDFTWQKPGPGNSSAMRLDVSAVPSCREGLEESWRAPGLHPYWTAGETKLYCQWRLAKWQQQDASRAGELTSAVWRQTGKKLDFCKLAFFSSCHRDRSSMFRMHLSALIKVLVIGVSVGFTSGQVDQPKWTITHPATVCLKQNSVAAHVFIYLFIFFKKLAFLCSLKSNKHQYD